MSVEQPVKARRRRPSNKSPLAVGRWVIVARLDGLFAIAQHVSRKVSREDVWRERGLFGTYGDALESLKAFCCHRDIHDEMVRLGMRPRPVPPSLPRRGRPPKIGG